MIETKTKFQVGDRVESTYSPGTLGVICEITKPNGIKVKWDEMILMYYWGESELKTAIDINFDILFLRIV